MRRIVTNLMILIALSAPLYAPPLLAGAVNVLPGCTDIQQPALANTDTCIDAGTQKNAGNNNPVIAFLKLAINVVSYIGGAAAVIVLILSAIRMIISNGDSNAITAARSGIIYSLVGIAVIILAQSLVIFVLDKIK